MQRRQRDYLNAVEPIARERANLATMFSRMTILETGEVLREYPPRVQAIDDGYVELTKMLRMRFLGAADAGGV